MSSSNTTPGLWVSDGLPGDAISHVLSQPVAGESSVGCATPAGEDCCHFVPGFLWPLPHVLFPFADFALYLLTVLNHSGEDDRLVGPPRDALNLGWSWGPSPQHRRGDAIFAGCASLTPLLTDCN